MPDGADARSADPKPETHGRLGAPSPLREGLGGCRGARVVDVRARARDPQETAGYRGGTPARRLEQTEALLGRRCWSAPNEFCLPDRYPVFR